MRYSESIRSTTFIIEHNYKLQLTFRLVYPKEISCYFYGLLYYIISFSTHNGWFMVFYRYIFISIAWYYNTLDGFIYLVLLNKIRTTNVITCKQNKNNKKNNQRNIAINFLLVYCVAMFASIESRHKKCFQIQAIIIGKQCEFSQYWNVFNISMNWKLIICVICFQIFSNFIVILWWQTFIQRKKKKILCYSIRIFSKWFKAVLIYVISFLFSAIFFLLFVSRLHSPQYFSSINHKYMELKYHYKTVRIMHIYFSLLFTHTHAKR